MSNGVVSPTAVPNSNAYRTKGPRLRHHAEVRDSSQRERSHRDLPRTPEEDVDEDLLIAALDAAGLQPTLAAWDDERWTGRSSAWPFCARRGTTSITSMSSWHGLCMPEPRRTCSTPWKVVHWNTHKGYLRHLAKQGVPVVPTAWLGVGEELDLADLMADRGWHDVVANQWWVRVLPHRSDHRSTNAGG